MAYEKFGRFVELAALQMAALFLDRAELLESFLELAGEARAVQAERGECAISVEYWVSVAGCGESSSASRNGMRLRRQAVLAISWTS